MSVYSAQFISMICCNFLYADEYIDDMVMHLKSRIRKLSAESFSLQLRIRDPYGKEHVLETNEAAEYRCPESLCGQRCTELPVEVFCEASCAPEKLKEAIHTAIAESAEANNMTPFFLREEVE